MFFPPKTRVSTQESQAEQCSGQRRRFGTWAVKQTNPFPHHALLRSLTFKKIIKKFFLSEHPRDNLECNKCMGWTVWFFWVPNTYRFMYPAQVFEGSMSRNRTRRRSTSAHSACFTGRQRRNWFIGEWVLNSSVSCKDVCSVYWPKDFLGRWTYWCECFRDCFIKFSIFALFIAICLMCRRLWLKEITF